ncbi:MAG: excinuclease ABC subunit UvrA [Hydrotalea sp.]|nr:excinuclease ABC subunit UvrA [Hydrotalea sp.]
MQQDKIIIKGARQNNLKNISLELPRNKLVVITGLSGSGKSSLAFDTIFAEGQRRYVESLSSYARQFLEMMQKPDVDSIEGLSPAISIEQKTTSRNPRSTVGTVTEIYDYMRLMWARAGIPYSPATGLPIESQTVSQMVDSVMKMDEGMKIFIMAPVVRGRKGEYRKEMLDYRKKGFQRIKIDGNFYELDDIPTLDKNLKHTISVVVDRLVVSKKDDAAEKEFARRLAESIEQALKLSEGLMTVEEATGGKEHIFSEQFSCPVSGFTIEEIEPRLFSFNNPHGACAACGGIGEKRTVDEALLVPNDKLSLKDGALQGWGGANPAPWYRQTLEALCKAFGGDMHMPYRDLPAKTKKAIIHGTKEAIDFQFDDGVRKVKSVKPFEGVIANLERRYRETESNWAREDIERYMSVVPCNECGGMRLKPEALAVKINKKHISEVAGLSISEAQKWFSDLPNHLDKKRQTIAERILREIKERLQFLDNVGLDYLSLSRPAGSLSGGESQRIRLASQIGSGLTGVLYVLDEPSIGLHQRDNARLLTTLERLRDLGNTVIVVEHDEDAMRHADYLIDIGPGAGIHGGHLVAIGTPAEVLKSKDSITAQYLSGKKEITIPKNRRKGNGKKLGISGAKSNNLKNVGVEIPLGTLTCVTGVSGSGKSTLILETLYPALSKALMGSTFPGLPYDKLENSVYLDKVIDIDQSPIGRTPRSNPATYTGLFTPIRDWYTNLPEAKARGYDAGRFSFNVKGGRCEACQGDGMIKIEMHFLPDVYVVCDQCRGKRYNRETLDITWRDKNIFDILDMTVEEGHKFFAAVPFIKEKLETLERVGLGYIKIGQSATTLSGGEAQRIKLAKELSRKATGKTIYILDEPTTGLHIEDVRKLLDVLQALVEQGNTVLVIEHNLEVIKCADWVIDMGPEGGDKGGQVVAIGTPEDIAASPKSLTGEFLKPILKRK